MSFDAFDVDILFHFFKCMTKSPSTIRVLMRCSQVSPLWNQIANQTLKHDLHRKNDPWFWAAYRLKKSQYFFEGKLNEPFSAANWIPQMGLFFYYIHKTNCLYIKSVYGSNIWFPMGNLIKLKDWPLIHYVRIPARLSPTISDILIIHTLNDKIILNITDPGFPIVIELQESIDKFSFSEFGSITELVYLAGNEFLKQLNFIKCDPLLCPPTFWNLYYRSSSHPEYEKSKWSMIRTKINQIEHHVFDNNVLISTQQFTSNNYTIEESWITSGAGRFLLYKNKNTASIKIFDSVLENNFLLAEDFIPTTEISSALWDNKRFLLLCFMDSETILLYDAKEIQLHQTFIRRDPRYMIYINTKNRFVFWINTNSGHKCKKIKSIY